jgi:hypothetical protein
MILGGYRRGGAAPRGGDGGGGRGLLVDAAAGGGGRRMRQERRRRWLVGEQCGSENGVWCVLYRTLLGKASKIWEVVWKSLA